MVHKPTYYVSKLNFPLSDAKLKLFFPRVPQMNVADFVEHTFDIRTGIFMMFVNIMTRIKRNTKARNQRTNGFCSFQVFRKSFAFRKESDGDTAFFSFFDTFSQTFNFE